ncbi:hypothetical protein ACWGS9_29090 [Bradyrhizobium sp. Arg314]
MAALDLLDQRCRRCRITWTHKSYAHRPVADGYAGRCSSGRRGDNQFAGRHWNSLSGGATGLLFLDEPANHLDIHNQLTLLAPVEGVRSEGV